MLYIIHSDNCSLTVFVLYNKHSICGIVFNFMNNLCPPLTAAVRGIEYSSVNRVSVERTLRA